MHEDACTLARIGIGSNLGNAVENVELAIGRLGALGELVAASSLYRSQAWGLRDQADFVNAAVLLDTSLEPRELLEALQRIETELGRQEVRRWGPRVIDLDILAYDDRVVSEPDLTIPHARLRERAFALVPLAEIDPSFIAWRDALATGDLAEVTPIDPNRGER